MMSKNFLNLAIGLVLAGCTTLSDIDQGIGKVADQVGTTDRITGQRVLGSGNRQAQIQKMNAAIDEAVKEGKAKGLKFNADLDATQYARLQKIVTRIIPITHFADEAPQWKVWLMPDDEWNAYVVGGSYIMVNKGFVDDKSLTDDDIAAVIGHEIGHVAANHLSERQAYGLIAGLSKNSSSKRDSFNASFGMGQEEEADKIGILYAALAGYDPSAASSVWQRKFEQSGNGGPYISSHPFNSERAKQTKTIAENVAQEGYFTKGKMNPNSQALLKDNVLWQYKPTTTQAGAGGGTLAVLETALNAYVQRQQAKSVEAEQLARKQIIDSVSKLIQVGARKAVDENTVIVNFTYRGNIPLRTFSVVAIAPNDDKPLVSHSSGYIPPNYTFPLTFTREGLGEKANQLKFNVDDASL